MNVNYISRTDSGFDSFQKNFINVLIAYYIAWAIRVADEANLITLQTTWTAAFATGGKNMVATRTKQQVKAKTVARKNYEAAIRQFVKQWIKANPLISDAQRVSMGVTVSKTTRTPVAIPDTDPLLSISPGSGSQLIIGFRQRPHVITSANSMLRSVAKPKGYHAVRIYYVVGGTAPTSIAGCNTTVGMTKSPHKLRFNAADAGKTVYLFACWVNTKEQEGPLTALHTVVIPS
ncbi:MAG: hypothetical protein ACYDCN_06385 [Bacteroidia bacterium]